jgi:hypothetical protein
MAMRRLGSIVAALALVAVASPLFAGDGPATGESWGKLGAYGSLYSAKTESTFEGKILTVVKIPLPNTGDRYCLALQVMRDGNPCTVYLGPGSFVAKRGFEFSSGDVISVTGSQVLANGREIVLAREVLKGDSTLAIRNEFGRHL